MNPRHNTSRHGQAGTAASDVAAASDDDASVIATTFSAHNTIASMEITSENDTILALSETNIPIVCCSFLASILIGATTYSFGLYGSVLKSSLHLTQSQLDTISTANFCAGLFVWVPGIFVDRFGTRISTTLGGVCTSANLMLQWAVATQRITIKHRNLNVVILSTLGVTTLLSVGLISGSVFRSVSCCCSPETRGSAVGIAKGYIGLGGGVFACLFKSIQSPTSSDLDFLPMMAIFYFVAVAVPDWFYMEQKPVADVLTPMHFRVLYTSIFSLAVIIAGTSLLSLHEDENGTPQEVVAGSTGGKKPNYFLSGAIFSIWIGPLIAQLFIPHKKPDGVASYTALGTEGNPPNEACLLQDDGGNHGNSLGPHESSVLVEAGDGDEISPYVRITSNYGCQLSGEQEEENEQFNSKADEVHDKNLFQLIKDPVAWVLLWIEAILVGGGIVETNNMGQMVESLGFPSGVTVSALALFSVSQTAGRVFTAVISDAALRWNTHRFCIDSGIPRPFFLVIASLIGALGHTILAISTDQFTFIVGVSLSGISFGSIFPILVLMVAEIFGTTHIATNYMFYDGTSAAVGTLLLSKVVAENVYESHIDNGDSDNVTCYGQACFQLTHIIIASLCFGCVALSCVVIYTTRNRYNNMHLHAS